MLKKYTISEHLKTIDQNAKVTAKEVNMLISRIRNKFRRNGLVKSAENDKLIREYIDMIFDTQDRRCSFWLPVEEGEINGIWNGPQKSGWVTKNILYEVDHVNPVNAGGTDSLTNFQFLSANANQFTKCSLPISLLLKRKDLSIELKDRIKSVLRKREDLFNSDKWKDYVDRVKAFENKQQKEV